MRPFPKLWTHGMYGWHGFQHLTAYAAINALNSRWRVELVDRSFETVVWDDDLLAIGCPKAMLRRVILKNERDSGFVDSKKEIEA